jgi:hypothetical protein
MSLLSIIRSLNFKLCFITYSIEYILRLHLEVISNKFFFDKKNDLFRYLKVYLTFLFLHLKQKLIIYESYVKDLSIQTRLLLQSLEELEKEANQRVALLENKLKKAHASLQV